MKKQHLLIMLAMALSALTIVPSVAFAEGSDTTSQESTETETPKSTDSTTQTEAQRKAARLAEAARKAELEAKAKAAREAAKQKAEEAKAQAKERLSGEREKRCSERESKVNEIISRSSTRGKNALAKFQTFQQRIESFVSEKSLTVESYETLLATAKAQEAAAVAAVEAAGATTFKCADQDSTNVGGTVSGVVTSQHQALKDYREALKALIKAVKAAAEAQKPTTTDDSAAGAQQ